MLYRSCSPLLPLVNAQLAILRAEAKFLLTLDCPYLIKCYETTHDGVHLFLVLEMLTGGELLDHIHKVRVSMWV